MGSSETEEQLRVRALLADTITLLCKNGLSFKQNMTIQGLIGITLDSNVFLVHLNENFRGEQADSSDIVMSPSVMSPAPSSDGGRRSPKRKRRRSSDNRSKQRKDSAEFDPDVRIKPEPEDIILIEEVKTGDREQSSCMLDEGLNFAVGSIQSFQQQAQGGASSSAAGGLSSASDSFQSTYQSSGGLDTSHGPGMSRAGPFVTGIVPHQTSASGQSNQGNETASGSFSWEGNPQGSHGNQPGTANWAGQLASQTMSSQGTSQTLPNIPPGASTSAGGRTMFEATLGFSKPLPRGRCMRPIPWSSECDACCFFQRKRLFFTQRAKLVKRGVQGGDLPVFTEQTIGADRSCLACQARLDHMKQKNTRSRLRQKLMCRSSKQGESRGSRDGTGGM